MSDGNPREMENKQVSSMIPPTTDLRDGGRVITELRNSLRPSWESGEIKVVRVLRAEYRGGESYTQR